MVFFLHIFLHVHLLSPPAGGWRLEKQKTLHFNSQIRSFRKFTQQIKKPYWNLKCLFKFKHIANITGLKAHSPEVLIMNADRQNITSFLLFASWFLLHLMLSKSICISKCFLAMLTGVWLNSRMYQEVCPQVTRLRKRLGTEITQKRHFPWMDAYMFL